VIQGTSRIDTPRLVHDRPKDSHRAPNHESWRLKSYAGRGSNMGVGMAVPLPKTALPTTRMFWRHLLDSAWTSDMGSSVKPSRRSVSRILWRPETASSAPPPNKRGGFVSSAGLIDSLPGHHSLKPIKSALFIGRRVFSTRNLTSNRAHSRSSNFKRYEGAKRSGT